ncbi:uncharacterized protein PFL1_00455 [Pseudozyma flocculosa PF-1]|uniref:SGF29 C-terminal domain-containing protein n=1 Tax=Pseudozyma flocculosa TaxID=84751 RepID=A0A5C3ESF8_9BASI|nr:uncharacterized protein PFL1_00455 [Pseudozyma flocculosa PF-1]EPQ32258.1 hypothetical protein PFL1_00455 [Pseudozyma flocculosa PF-1]SPO34790.1 uncharacterized protein PSFLO_00261 [Pseudozyma flocculosa]
MASRQRKDRLAQSGSEEVQLWHGVRTHLRTIERIRLAAQDRSGIAETLRNDLIVLREKRAAGDEYKSKRRRLDDICTELRQKTIEEQTAVDAALEKLGILTALRSSTDPGDHAMTRGSSSSGISTPVSRSKLADDRYGSSASKAKGTLGTTRRSYSTNTGLAGSSLRDSAGAGSTNGALSQPSGSGGSGGASSSAGGVDPARARREALAHQLPLQKGRKVAFRQPVKKAAPGAAGAGAAGGPIAGAGDAAAAAGLLPGEEDGETWIMATVIECINNDRNRYVVQDAEEEGPLGPTWNTTLKAIVPLPESVSTLPPIDYPVGAQVMGLYPDTSCFYRATVQGGGPGILRPTPVSKLIKREQELLNANYQLIFEDDGDVVRLVPAFLVVERPRT